MTHATTFDEVLALRSENARLKDQLVSERKSVVEACAMIAQPWAGFPTTEPNTYDIKLTEADKAVIEVRTAIAKNIRALTDDLGASK